MPDDPVRNGFIFRGWYFRGNKVDFETFVITNNVLTGSSLIFYARWIYGSEVKNIIELETGNPGLRQLQWYNPADSYFRRIIIYSEIGEEIRHPYVTFTRANQAFVSRHESLNNINFIIIRSVALSNIESHGVIHYWKGE